MIEAVNLTFSWNAYTDIAQHGTTLTDPSTMNETDFTIVQGTGTVQEWATRCRIRACWRICLSTVCRASSSAC